MASDIQRQLQLSPRPAAGTNCQPGRVGRMRCPGSFTGTRSRRAFQLGLGNLRITEDNRWWRQWLF